MRKRAYEIVYGVLEEQGHSDVIFHRITDGMKTLTVQEKRFLKRLSYGAIEWAVESDAYIRHFSSLSVRRLEPSVRTVLRMALYEILHMDTVPEAVSCHEAVELLKSVAGERYAGFVNGVLRSVLRQRDGKYFPACHPHRPPRLPGKGKTTVPRPLPGFFRCPFPPLSWRFPSPGSWKACCRTPYKCGPP